MSEGDSLPTPNVELPVVHELTTLEQLRAVSDPVRVVIFRLLREREQTVKALCEILNESSTRLYYHVSELERVGLVRLGGRNPRQARSTNTTVRSRSS